MGGGSEMTTENGNARNMAGIRASSNQRQGLGRRAFLKTAAASATILVPFMGWAQSLPAAASALPSRPGEMRRRRSAIGAGGLSKARLGRMHDVMAGHVERGEVPGLVTLVSRRGEVHVDAIGMKAVGGSDPMRRDTIFRIASMTKPITAAAAMILVEECKLRLDEPVDRLAARAGRPQGPEAASTGRSTTRCRRTGRSRCATC